MRQNIQANVALKTFSGLHFGTARWIQGDRIAFATDAEFNPGDRAELRMELSGKYPAVLAEVLIVRTYEIDHKGEIGCVAQIMDMPEPDSDRLNDWLSDLTEGGVGTQPSAWLESILRHQRSGPVASAEETRSALNRIDQRLGLSRSRSFTATAGHRVGGRQSIRDALKASFLENENDTPTAPTLSPPVAAPAPTPTPAPLQEVPAQVPPPAPVEESAAPTPGTNGLLEGEKDGLSWSYAGEKVLLQWAERAALAKSWNDGLKTGTIQIPMTGSNVEVQQAMTFRLTLPDGQILALHGRVASVDEDGLTCSVNVPWGARVKLQSASKT
jgi:hypothetical protein